MKTAKDFIHAKYHFGIETKRVWELEDIAKLMTKYARQACKEQRKLCGQAYIMQKGHHLEENINAITNAPEPELG